MTDLSALAWVLLALGAVVVGISKTALPGAGSLAVAIFAAVLPARTSTATLLLLIVGDVLALALYRRHAEWATLLRLAVLTASRASASGRSSARVGLESGPNMRR